MGLLFIHAIEAKINAVENSLGRISLTFSLAISKIRLWDCH